MTDHTNTASRNSNTNIQGDSKPHPSFLQPKLSNNGFTNSNKDLKSFKSSMGKGNFIPSSSTMTTTSPRG